MTNAIARWHSNAPCSRCDLEQVYADKLEAGMQDMAIQLHQVRLYFMSYFSCISCREFQIRISEYVFWQPWVFIFSQTSVSQYFCDSELYGSLNYILIKLVQFSGLCYMKICLALKNDSHLECVS